MADTLDRNKTALVVIDIQKGIAGMARQLAPHSANEVVANVAKLVSKFREARAPVFLVHVTSIDGKDTLSPIADQKMQWQGERPADWADFMDEIKPVQGDIVITKRQWGAFHGTELDLQLRRRGIDTIVLCGISTNIGVETTAREAYQHGYNQVFAVDAMSATTEEEHNATLKFIFPRIGRLRTTEQIIGMLG
ncbi:hydrolase [Candidatus Marsarchaeota archaeon]|jgi:nicotinamidase-related amidase|nr:hydrolase [Candidatus Marsarchaeota archaeon]MCL5100295.1 hydrolase [Candidatus Marsarchaeota archaeon]